MLKFIHVTDPHLVEPGQALYGTDPAQRLRRCVGDIAARHGDAAFVIVTGDLTHVGGMPAFSGLRDILASLPMPVHLIVGNHDTREDLAAVFPGTPRDPNGLIQGVVPSPEGDFILLDTLETGVSHGVFCARRADWLGRALAGGTGPVYLCLHHPPFPLGITGMDGISLRDPTDFWRAIEPHRARIRHIFFGHVHRPVSGSWRGIPFSTLHGTNHQVALHLGTGLSVAKAIAADEPVWSSDEPPHYGIVLIDQDHVVVHQQPFLREPESVEL
ncbi:phosphodiesterase [Dongia sp.]|uniref:phosphodiesterase n=1 Tax=Dongia sp. TaxID=1977262 RepID=UPI0035AE04DD